MKKRSYGITSLIYFTVSVPVVLSIMWLLETLVETPQEDSKIVQVSAVISLFISSIGTGIGLWYAILSSWKERPLQSLRPSFIAVVGITLNGICFLIWIILTLVMLANM